VAPITSKVSSRLAFQLSAAVRGLVDSSRTELDTHADTCVVGNNCLIVHEYDRWVTVTGYDPTQGSVKDLKVVGAVIAYDCPQTGEVIIIRINQAIHIKSMSNNLLCPMQIRMNDIKVFDCPKFLIENPKDIDHTLTLPSGNGEDYSIPLSLNGVTSYFPTRKPTQAEYDKAEDEGSTVDLTYDSPEWEPHSETFSNQEDVAQKTVDTESLSVNRFFCSVTTQQQKDATTVMDRLSHSSSILSEMFPCLNDDTLIALMESNVCQEEHNIASIGSSERTPGITAEDLVQNWGISLEAAKRTVEGTTQRGVRTVGCPTLSRRFRTNDRQLRYRRIRTDIFTDTMFSSVKSKRGNKCAQVYSHPTGWIRAFPMRLEREAHESLSVLFKRDGVPNNMVMDGAKTQIHGEFKKKCRESGCHIKQVEPYSPWSNSCEVGIKMLKQASGRDLRQSKCPKVLWDDCIERQSYIRSFTAHDNFALKGECPETLINGETPDISAFGEYGWYDWVKFRDTQVAYPEDNFVLGRYLGPSFDVGPAMTAKILKENGQYIHSSTLRHLTPDELICPLEIKTRVNFDSTIELKLGVNAKDIDFVKGLEEYDTPHLPKYEDEQTEGDKFTTPDRDSLKDDHFDQYLNAAVLLPSGDRLQTGKVTKRKKDENGVTIGVAHDKTMLDTREYIVEFPDGAEMEFSANKIAEAMITQCDIEGNQHLLLDCITDFKMNEHAVQMADKDVIIKGRKYLKKTTKGWHLCCNWKDGTSTWERLADLKESNPIEVAEYAVAQDIAHQPAFAWWVPFTLKKRKSIICAVKARFLKKTHKFGIEIPQKVSDAKRIDDANGNRYWQDAIAKEMKAVRIAFKILHGDKRVPPTYQQIRCHIIFDVKMEDFRRKARYVAQGNMTEAPKTLTYASVVSRESVRIALTLAALNDLEVKSADIKNAYLTAPVTEKIWTILGPEFGEDAGKKAIIVRALYGLKSAGAAFRNHLADCMKTLGYESCLADQDLWWKPEIRPSDGHRYYSYILLYVDDALCIHHDGKSTLESLDRYFQMKEGSIGDPDLYLGAKLRKVTLPNGVQAWSTSPSKYIQEAVKNVEKYLHIHCGGRKLAKRANAPFPRDYAPELDISTELDPKRANYYQSLMGVLQWMVEIGRVDMITEVSMMASQLAMPREGHLECLFHMFSYLNIKHNSRMVFDPTYPTIDMSQFKECEWKTFYASAKEAIPGNAPEPRGKEVDLRLYVDSDHAGDTVTRRSRSGFFIFMNMALVSWHFKKQSTIETSVFGAEFVAMKVAMEVMRGLRYKLRMMGVPLSGPTYTYGDNMSVIHNTQRPESVLKKKSNSICYHAIRESVAMEEMLTAHVPTAENPADLGTKVIPGGQKRDHLVSKLLYDLSD